MINEWGVFGVIASIVALFIAIGAPIIKLNSNVTTLNNQIKVLQKCIDDYKSSNKEAHKKIWTKIEEHSNSINELEKEIEFMKIEKRKESEND